MKYMTTLLLALMTTCSAIAGEGSMYCGNQWMNTGDSNTLIYDMCGKPSHVKVWTEKSYQRFGMNLVETDTHFQRWTYSRKTDAFIEYLTFRNGVLVDMTDGDINDT